MPRDFGQIQSAFWRHPDIRQVSHHAMLVMAYLLSSPHANGLGCYCLPMDYACGDLRMNEHELRGAFSELADKGLVMRCDVTEYVLIRGFLKWNRVYGPKVAGARYKEISAVPSECSLREELVAQIEAYGGEHFTVPDTLSNGYRNPSPRTRPPADPTRSDPNRTGPTGPGSSSESPPYAREAAAHEAAQPRQRVDGTCEIHDFQPMPHANVCVICGHEEART